VCGAVEISGISLTFLDIPASLTQEYNRWYDLDHMPEHVSKADVVMGRRYVAPRALRTAAGVLDSEQFGGHAPYATIYFFGGPLDFTGDEARELWRVKDRGIVKQGRYWLEGRATHGSRWRMGEAVARPDVHVAPEAIAHLNHRGVIVAIGRAPSVERREEALAWWRDVHLVDLFAVPGVLAALRMDPVGADEDLVLHLLLCDGPTLEVMAAIEEAKRYTRAIGRFPAHGGAYEPLTFLPYDRIVPFEYDFDLGSG
jgi:hypothetical protein